VVAVVAGPGVVVLALAVGVNIRDPPCEQLLAGMGVGTGSSIVVVGGLALFCHPVVPGSCRYCPPVVLILPAVRSFVVVPSSISPSSPVH
jgi:hypothetical protein